MSTNNGSLAALQAQVSQLKKDLAEAKKPAYPQGAPHIRKGEDPLSSRPFYISELAKSMVTRDWTNAKQEREECKTFKKAMTEYYGGGYANDSVLLPLSWYLLPSQIANDSRFASFRKSMTAGGEIAATQDQEQFAYELNSVIKKAPMSTLNQLLGGALIRPPEFGELIPVLRNKSVLNQIGARQVALPPQGSIMYPRQTSATTPSQTPENPSTAVSESDFGTDQLTLTANTFMGLCRASNQLLRFSQGVAESLIRDDMMAQVALLYDKAGLEGRGGPTRIVGLINTDGINRVTAATTGTDGNTWVPKELTRMIAAAQEVNSDIDVWIMRPGMFLGMTEFRTGGSTTGDGPYLFDLIRTVGQDIPDKLRGRKVYTSNQVANNRVKGSGINLTYVLGVKPEEVILGMHGAVELSLNTQAESAYKANQSLLRVVMYGDVGVAHAAGVTVQDELVQLSI